MASIQSLDQTVTRLPSNFLSLPRELRHEILLSLIEPPSRDLFPGSGNYEDGRNDDWYGRHFLLEQEVETISTKLKQATSHPELTDDIEHVKSRWRQRILRLDLSWLWKAYEDGRRDSEEWGTSDDSNDGDS